jgi:hypothetical protein
MLHRQRRRETTRSTGRRDSEIRESAWRGWRQVARAGGHVGHVWEGWRETALGRGAGGVGREWGEWHSAAAGEDWPWGELVSWR